MTEPHSPTGATHVCDRIRSALQLEGYGEPSFEIIAVAVLMAGAEIVQALERLADAVLIAAEKE